jgi:hypothetical protein
MNADPYAPPHAALEAPVSEPPLPRLLRMQILSSVFAGALCAAVTAYHALRALADQTPVVYAVYYASAALVMSGLAYGTYRGGRTCAVLALLSFLFNQAALLERYGLRPSSTIALLLLFCYLYGAIGTFRWHQLRNTLRNAAAAA